MTAIDIAKATGGDVFELDYDHLDLAHTENLTAGSWGLYIADPTISIDNAITPGVDVDGVTSLAGTYTVSISLAHLDAYTTAHVNYDGSGFTLQYTLNGGTTWTNLSEDGVISLPTNADLDFKVSFPGGIANDTSILNRLTVYILNSETLRSDSHSRTLTFSADPMTPGGLVIDASVTVAAADESGTLDPNGPSQVGSADFTIGTLEAWITNTTTSVFGGVTGTLYVNGVAAANVPVTGSPQHCVLVLNTPANAAFTVGTGTLSHLAVYQQAMSAADVLTLYQANMGPLTLVVNDSDTITVTESSPATDIYAYTWAIASGGNS